MLSKSLIQFSVDRWSSDSSLLFTWGQTMVEVVKIMRTSFKISHAKHCYTNCPEPRNRPPPTHWRLLDTHRQVWVSPCGVTAPFSWVLVHTRFCLCPPRVYFPVLYKFWQFCGGVNGNLLQEDLCQTQVCCTQSPCPCNSPLLTCTSIRDTQTQFCLRFQDNIYLLNKSP